MRMISRMVILWPFFSWFCVSFYACSFCIFQNRDIVGDTCNTWSLARNRVCTPRFLIKNIWPITQIVKVSMHQKRSSKNEDSIRKCETRIAVSFSRYNWISMFVLPIFCWYIFALSRHFWNDHSNILVVHVHEGLDREWSHKMIFHLDSTHTTIFWYKESTIGIH